MKGFQYQDNLHYNKENLMKLLNLTRYKLIKIKHYLLIT